MPASARFSRFSTTGANGFAKWARIRSATTPSEQISKKQLDKLLSDGDAEAAGVIHGAIEEFAQEFAAVVRRLLRLKCWKDTERIVVGGGLRQSRIGELAIGRTAVMLKADGHEIELKPIRHEPDHAGLIGSVQLVPALDPRRPRQHPGC